MIRPHAQIFLCLICSLLFGIYPYQARSQQPATISIAFGSCHNQLDSPVWEGISRKQPGAVLLLGDNLYLEEAPLRGAEPARYIQERYSEVLGAASFQALAQRIPVYALWDDHDFGPNDADASFTHKIVSRKAFRSWFPRNPKAPPELNESTAFTIRLGPVTVVAPDGRWYRRYFRGQGADRLFGDAQLRWIAQSLLGASTRYVILASGSQLFSRGSANESLLTMPHERRALLAAIRAAQHAGKIIYVLSGDRHYSEVLKIPESGKDFYEITSSPLSAAPRQGGAAPQFEPRRQLGPFNSNNFAVLTLGEQRVTVAYYSQAGELLGELQL